MLFATDLLKNVADSPLEVLSVISSEADNLGVYQFPVADVTMWAAPLPQKCNSQARA